MESLKVIRGGAVKGRETLSNLENFASVIRHAPAQISSIQTEIPGIGLHKAQTDALIFLNFPAKSLRNETFRLIGNHVVNLGKLNVFRGD